MKVLHSKTAPEPILLVSACPTMNLFAIVTHRALVVYRSTTLTALVSITLQDVDVVAPAGAAGSPDSSRDAACLKACWTPSGSIFTLALASGVILLVDVESGELIRRLVPSRHAAAAVEASSSHGRRAGLATAMLSTLDDGAVGGGGNGRNEEAEKATDTDDEEEDIMAFHRRCRRVLWRPPTVPLSTAVAEPVCALTWVRVSSASSSSTTTMPEAVHTSNRAASTPCAPLQSSLSAPLLAELGGPFAMSRPRETAAPCDGDTETTATSILVVLDATGVLSLVQGGLYEVAQMHVQLPHGLHPREGSLQVQQFAIIDTTATASAPQLHTDVADAGRGGPAVPLVVPENVPFSELATHWLMNQLSGAPSDHISRTIASGGQTQQQQQQQQQQLGHRHHSHHGVLLVVPREGKASPPSPSANSQGHILLLPLADRLSALATNSTTTALCFIAEATLLAETCRRTAVARWQHALNRHTRRPLQLPANAALLQDALVEEVAQPDPVALVTYYQSLPRDRLSHAVAALDATLASVGVDMLLVARPCQQAALQVAQREPLQRNRPSPSQPRRSSQKGAVRVASSSVPSLQFADRTHGSREGDWQALIAALARQQRECEMWLSRVRIEAQIESNLVQWVLQRASLTLALEGLLEEDADGAGVTIPLPLPVAQHPGLLRALRCIQEGRSTAWSTVTATPTTTPTAVHHHLDEEAAGGEAKAEEEITTRTSSSRTRSRGAMESDLPHATTTSAKSHSCGSEATSTTTAASVEVDEEPASTAASASYCAVVDLIQHLWANGPSHDCAPSSSASSLSVSLLGVKLDRVAGAGTVGGLCLLDFLSASAIDSNDDDEGDDAGDDDGDEAHSNEEADGDEAMKCEADLSRPPCQPLMRIYSVQAAECSANGRGSSSLALCVSHVSRDAEAAAAAAAQEPSHQQQQQQQLAAQVKATCGEPTPIALAETGDKAQSLGALTHFVALSPSRHWLLFSTATEAGTSAGSVTAVMVQGDGHVEMTEVEEDEEVEEASGGANEEDDTAVGDDGSGADAEAVSERPVVLSIPGIEAPLKVAVSRSREFGVVAALDKFVVLDLYQE